MDADGIVYEQVLRQGGDRALRKASVVDLPLSFAAKLAPSVRAAYHDLWQAAREGSSGEQA